MLEVFHLLTLTTRFGSVVLSSGEVSIILSHTVLNAVYCSYYYNLG